jgi:hypothetical protein
MLNKGNHYLDFSQMTINSWVIVSSVMPALLVGAFLEGITLLEICRS